MSSVYNHYHIRLYLSMLDNIKFKHGRAEKGWYADCLLLLAKCDDKTKGWAYLSGIALDDELTSKKLECSVEEWKEAKAWLTEDKLLFIKDGAWGVGSDRWDEHQGAVERLRRYNREYQKIHRSEHKSIPESPRY